MDIKCHLCLEPIDVTEFHDVADELGTTYREVTRDFQVRGCDALGEFASHNYMTMPKWHTNEEAEESTALAMLNELLGDDIDGIASLAEDFGL